MYALGGVKPWVRDAANDIGSRFGVRTILGVGVRPGPSDHMSGLALDFMVPLNSERGSAIASYVVSNAGKLGVTYVIWQQRIWSAQRSQEGWRAMENRGSNTANHRDHVHVSFTTDGQSASGGGGGGITDPLGRVGGALDALNPLAPIMPVVDAVQWLTDGHNLLRVAAFVGGLALLIVALGAWAFIRDTAGKVTTTVKGTT